MIKLDLGAESTSPPGFTPMGNAHGTEIYPLAVDDGSIDVIRASHVLEHFPFREVPKVLKHWAEKLKPGGVLKIAVPNFAWIAQAYIDGLEAPIEEYTVGGQTAPDDFHKALFDVRTLSELLRDAGFVDVKQWDADTGDCSRLPVSLNLRAVKPVPILPGQFKLAAVMSMPRLGFTDNFMCAQNALNKLGIEVRPFTGAFWGQCLQRGIETLIAEGFDYILTIDYDTVFTEQNVKTLIRLMHLHPEVDAICPLQSARGWNSPLLTMALPDGMVADKIPRNYFDGDMVELRTGHFGLTMFRASALKDVPKPWFLGVAAEDGTWGDGHVDDDIYFWRKWQANGKKLFNANRVVVGHCELMVKWPGRDLGVIHQRVVDFWNQGPPKEVWK